MLSPPLISLIPLPGHWEPKHYVEYFYPSPFTMSGTIYGYMFSVSVLSYVNRMKLYASFCNLLFSLNILFIKLIHIATGSSGLFILISVYCYGKISFPGLLCHLVKLFRAEPEESVFVLKFCH